MATKEIVELVDDTDGTPATGTTRFALDQVNYEIDLSKANGDALRELLAPYIDKGRRITRTPPPSTRRQRADDPRVDAAAKEHRRKARAWGKKTGWRNPANGKPIGDLGVVPASLLADYDAAQLAATATGPHESPRNARVPAVTFRVSG